MSPYNRILATKRLAASVDLVVPVDKACLVDLRWWHTALSLRNGISFLEHDHDIVLEMNASGNGWQDRLHGLIGFNFSQQEYWCGPPPPKYYELDICDLETICHVVSCIIWASTWKHKQILSKTLASPTDQPTDGRYQAKESRSFISY